MITLFSFQFTTGDLLIFLLVAIFVGMSKTGVHGTGMISVPLLASVFGGQLSSGVMLPLLCIADVMGVWYYHRHASWSHLKKLFPWAVVGTILGTIVGGMIDDVVFKMIMALIIVASVIIMLWLERGRHKENIPDNKWFASLTGTTGGFSSMVGNLAGSVMAVYFLSMRLPKNTFIGTTAWFFMVMNWFKVPFHVFAWHTISWNTFMLDLIAIPLIAVGAFLGIVIVRNIPERLYRWFIIGMTLIAAIMMLI
ncbi:MAG TPA: sulfite exporter TauE/SafE family protein [Ohtaekwangia sp.]|uniref:sulfite exporter TauE/SafE family protein n=1 Tax=Ohtaekwangia sp. TaxID=2066019 RepID=UPI002F923E19